MSARRYGRATKATAASGAIEVNRGIVCKLDWAASEGQEGVEIDVAWLVDGGAR